jgi:hypothetical protein
VPAVVALESVWKRYGSKTIIHGVCGNGALAT